MSTRTESPSPSSRPLGLWLPFACVGLAGGWLSDGLLANPMVGLVPRRSQLTAAIYGAILGALLGAVLSDGRRAFRTPLTTSRLAALVVGWGALAGGLVGGMEAGPTWSGVGGALFGALSGLAFVPVCALVLAAALRAERARQGSIVASADRRAVWSILATTLAVTTLAGALDVLSARGREAVASPRVGLGVGAAAWLLVAAVLVADALALRRVFVLGRQGLEERDPGDARDRDAVPTVDLGLGEDVRARMGLAADAYRSRTRPVALLLGSVAEARSALRRAILRGAVGLAIASAVLFGHRWAETPAALVAYLERRCERSKPACYEAGLLRVPEAAPRAGPPVGSLGDLEQRATSADFAAGMALLGKACDAGYRDACDAILRGWTARFGAGPGASEPPLPDWYVRPRPLAWDRRK